MLYKCKFFLYKTNPDVDGTLARNKAKKFCHKRGRIGCPIGVSSACCDQRYINNPFAPNGCIFTVAQAR